MPTPSLLVKDLTQDAYRLLRELAKAHHHSMSKEAAMILGSKLGVGRIPEFSERFKMEDPPRRAGLLKALVSGRRKFR